MNLAELGGATEFDSFTPFSVTANFVATIPFGPLPHEVPHIDNAIALVLDAPVT
jgi:hypothetical protein